MDGCLQACLSPALKQKSKKDGIYARFTFIIRFGALITLIFTPGRMLVLQAARSTSGKISINFRILPLSPDNFQLRFPFILLLMFLEIQTEPIHWRMV